MKTKTKSKVISRVTKGTKKGDGRTSMYKAAANKSISSKRLAEKIMGK